jgi:hypothetical protein
VKLIYPREKETERVGIPIDSGGGFIVARRDNVASGNELRRRVRKKYIGRDVQFLREHYLGSGDQNVS